MLTVLFAMLQILLGVAALFLIAAFVFPGFFIPVIAYWLAKMKILVRPVEENTARWIERGGKAWRCITPGADEDPVLVPEADGRETWPLPSPRRAKDAPLTSAEGPESWLVNTIDHLLPGGIRYVGLRILGYHIKEYNFRWKVVREDEPLNTEDSLVNKRQLESGKWIATFAKVLDYIFLRETNYASEINDAETSELMPVKIVVNMRVKVVDPYLPIYGVHDWLETMLGDIRPFIRSWIRRNTFKDVVGKHEAVDPGFDDEILNSTGLTPEQLAKVPPGTAKPRTLAEYLRVVYGVLVNRIGFEEVIPPKEYTVAATKRVEAEQNKVAKITNAEGQRDSDEIIGVGEAKRLEPTLVLMASNPDAIRLREIEALENVGANGNMVVMGGNGSQLLLSPPQKRLVEPVKERVEKKGGKK